MFSDSVYGGKEAARRAARNFKRTAMARSVKGPRAGGKATKRRRAGSRGLRR
jgi:hypothetical protein